MANYYANTFRAMTPIGQAMQNIASAMFQSQTLAGTRAMKERELAAAQAHQNAQLAMEQAKLDAQMPMWAAQTRKFEADAAKDLHAVEQARAAPDTIASSFAGITRPQLGQFRERQRLGDWVQPMEFSRFDNQEVVEGNHTIAQKPDWYTKGTADKLSIADTVSAMSGNAEQMGKGMRELSDLQFVTGAPSVADVQRRGMASAAVDGKALFGNPNNEGLVGDLFTGAVLNQNNPLANAQVSADRALAGERNATARLRGEQVNTEIAQQGKYRAETETERRNPGGSKGALTEMQRMDISTHNNTIGAARKQLKALWDTDRDKFADRLQKARKGEDKAFQTIMERAASQYKGQDDPNAADWGAFLVGDGWTTGKGYTPAGQARPANPTQGKKPGGGSAYIAPNGRKVQLQEIEETARKRGKTPVQVIQDFGLTPEA